MTFYITILNNENIHTIEKYVTAWVQGELLVPRYWQLRESL